jgi:hypothetical protein
MMLDLMTAVVAAIAFAALSAGAVLFQLALALGAPWGSYAMGGKYPGRFPPPMRVAAVVQAIVIALLAVLVLVHAGLVPWSLPAWLVWIPVAFSALSLVMNAISRSPGERRLWTPVAAGLVASSLTVALTAD